MRGDANAVDLFFFWFDMADDAGDGDLFMFGQFAFRNPKTCIGACDALFSAFASNALKEVTKFVGAGVEPGFCNAWVLCQLPVFHVFSCFFV